MTINVNLPTYYLASTYTNHGNHNNCLYIYENFYNRFIIPFECLNPKIIKTEVEECYHIKKQIDNQSAEILLSNLNRASISHFLKSNLNNSDFFLYQSILKINMVLENYSTLKDLRAVLGMLNQTFFLYKELNHHFIEISNLALIEVDTINDGILQLNKIKKHINHLR